MKYLTEAFENDFKEIKNRNKKNSGKKFENLVFLLLDKYFPDFTWKDTPVTHDGSKDFYAQSEERIYWAECKNYTKTISLQTIAPTLIMAELCNVDEIYFFSYSLINDNVKRKLCYYAYINHKRIRFYDDIALEQLIFYNTLIYNRYFKKYVFPTVDFQNEAVPKILYNCLRNPFLNYKKDDIFLTKTTLPKFKINEIISLQVCVINNNFSKEAYINIEISDDNEDILCFELLDKDKLRSNIVQYHYSDTVNPNEVFFLNIDLKIIGYKPYLKLPRLNVTVSQENYKKCNELPWCNLECSQIYRAGFIGPVYHDILGKIEQYIINNNILSGFLLIGSSGTGKSRILEETLSLFIKYDYKVLNFIGIENDSGKNIIKEIVYVLFQVSEELIASSFILNDKENSSLSLAFKMLCDINQNKCDFVAIIDKYSEIIFEKLMHNQYALIIDNLQYFDYSLIYFIEKLIMYSKNNNRKNTLVLAFSLNTDYLFSDTEATKIQRLFHQLENTGACHIKVWNIEGFQTEGSALEFMKQLLNIKNSYYDTLLRLVIEKSSLRPYYIESIIGNLNQFKSVTYTKEGFTIKKPSLFKDELKGLPLSAEEKLNLRWHFFINSHENNNDYIQILSVIHIFGTCELGLVSTLDLNESLLYILCKYNFLKREYSSFCEYYTFEHDLMEDFFCKHIPDFNSYAYGYLTNLDYKKLEQSYPIVYYLCTLYVSDYNLSILEKIIENGVKYNISYKIFFTYYQNCTKALIEFYEKFNNKNKWYSLFLFCGIQVKKRMGNEAAHTFFEQFFPVLEEDIFENKYYYSNFAEILFYYGEIKQQLALYDEVISLYRSYLKNYQEIKSIKNNEFINCTITFIYNRLSVAYKHIPGIYGHKKRMEYINLSLYLSRNLANHQYLAENCYDKGTYYYCHKKNKKIVLAYWQSCCNLIKKYKIELMTLHYIEHRIQIGFIKKELDDILELIEYGTDYLKHGKYNEQSIYFKRFFSQAEAVYWLIKKENYDRVKTMLDQSEEDALMLGKNNFTYINYLRGKLYFYLKDKIQCYQFYKKAYEDSINLSILYKDDFVNMLVDDMLIKFRILELDDSKYTSIFWYNDTHSQKAHQIQAMTNAQFIKFYNDYQASSIITSLDQKENFPHI